MNDVGEKAIWGRKGQGKTARGVSQGREKLKRGGVGNTWRDEIIV